LNSKLYEVLQVNKNFLTTEIDHLENFDSSVILNLFDAVYHSLYVMAITHYITLEEADFALEQSANLLSYLVKEKFGKDIEFIER
jgi:hypothetical protein